MIIQSTNTDISSLRDVITWAEGWHDREWAELTGYQETPPILSNKIALIRNHYGIVLVVWSEPPTNSEYAAISFSLDHFRHQIEWEQWFIDGSDIYRIDDGGISEFTGDIVRSFLRQPPNNPLKRIQARKNVVDFNDYKKPVRGLS